MPDTEPNVPPTPDSATPESTADTVDYKVIAETREKELSDLRASHKSVQREIERLRRQGRDQSALMARQDEIIDRLSVLESVVVSGGVDDTTRERIATTQTRTFVQRNLEAQAQEQARLIQEALNGVDLDWDSAPELEAAREHWQRGAAHGDPNALRESARETIRAIKEHAKRTAAPPAKSAAPPEPPPAPKPAARVDTGGSTAPSKSPITVESVASMSATERAERWDEIRKALWGV